MVDVGATTQAMRTTSHPRDARPAAQTQVSVRQAGEEVLAEYEALCASAVHGPAQHPVWIRAWLAAAEADLIVATIHNDGRPVCALALEVVRQGGVRIARFAGGSHANGNFAATDGTGGWAVDEQMLVDAIRMARPDIDLLLLERQNPEQDGVANPLAALATARSANISLATDLDGGFEAMLSRMSGKRKRKKYRLQDRKFQDEGGYRFIDASTPEEVERLISDFYVMKAARLRKKGIPDAFGTPEVQAFFRLLFKDALGHDPAPFRLRALEVAGELRAVNGLSLVKDRVVCDFGGIRETDSSASPGFFLDFDTVRQAGDEGVKVFDFSVGDEHYKRSWCDLETWQFDTLLPLTLKGRISKSRRMTQARLLRSIKSNKALWSFLKKMRARTAGSATAGEG